MLYKDVFLHSGDIIITAEKDVRINTILGSCIGIIFYNPRFQLGGIVHSLLPENNINNKNYTDLHFVDSSIMTLIKAYTSKGISPIEIEVKIFGGSNKISKSLTDNMGYKNYQKTITTLHELGLSITAEDCLGSDSRKIIFYPAKGDVFVKKLVQQNLN